MSLKMSTMKKVLLCVITTVIITMNVAAITITPTPIIGIPGLITHKPIYASSSFSTDFPVTNANDGNENTVWGSQIYTGAEWIFADMGAIHEVNQLIIKWFDPYYATDYAVGISNDGKNWTIVYKTTNGNGGVDELKSAASAKTRYIGLLLTKGRSVAYGIKEIEAYGPTITPTPTTSPTAPPTMVPAPELDAEFSLDSETATNFTGTLTIKNPYSSYLWNGSIITTSTISFESTATGLSTQGAEIVDQVDNVTRIDLTWQSNFELNKSVDIIIRGTKAGTSPIPNNFKITYVRGDTSVMYPMYPTLPTTWKKNKPDLNTADLIADQTSYYKEDIGPHNPDMIIYNPLNPTQLFLGQTYKMNYPVSGFTGVRIRVLSKYMAMGLGLAYEWFRINPNYMIALGTKENYAAGLVPPEAGNPRNKVEINGEIWYWPIQSHHDGPYQQETPNFDECKMIMYDYLSHGEHNDIVGLFFTENMVDEIINNQNWITSTFSSALSLTVTRETLYAVENLKFKEYVQEANDPFAEFHCVTFSYNRGINAFLTKNVLTTEREKGLQSSNIIVDFDMDGFGGHVPTVREVTKQICNDLTDLYDEEIYWEDMEVMFSKLRNFYQNGVPSDSEWTAMTADVKKAFNVLAQKWGGTYISSRYDYLTLLRVAKQYLPAPYAIRPSSQHWHDLIKNINDNSKP